jgi:hypothetical protein
MSPCLQVAFAIYLPLFLSGIAWSTLHGKHNFPFHVGLVDHYLLGSSLSHLLLPPSPKPLVVYRWTTRMQLLRYQSCYYTLVLPYILANPLFSNNILHSLLWCDLDPYQRRNKDGWGCRIGMVLPTSLFPTKTFIEGSSAIHVSKKIWSYEKVFQLFQPMNF